MKECLSCHNKIEDLRHTCPHCGSTGSFSAGSDDAISMIDAMQKQAEAAKHVDRGAQLILQENYTDAINELRLAIEMNPFNATAHGNMGDIYLRQKLFNEAIPWLEKALELNPHLEGVPQALAQAKSMAKK